MPACVLGDPMRLRQVLLNLIGNAIKFTAQGGVTVSVCPSEETDLWCFSVRDTGIGIASSQLSKVFERFSQADETTTRRFGGTGLGTSISREIVELMGGQIWAESEEGKGSDFKFTVRLPVATGLTDCSCVYGGPQISAAPHTRPLKILLAEDIQLNQELAIRRLTQRKHTVVVAENGRIAVEKFCEGGFDLILMDVMMPEMDGSEATRTIRAMEQESGGHIPIIMLTASVMQSDQKKYFEAGADEFIGKPIDFAELYTKIAQFFPVVETADAHKVAFEVGEKLPLVAGLDVRSSVAVWGDWAAYRKALIDFRRDYADGAERLCALFDGACYDQARLLAHSLKGLAGSIGAKSLAQAMVELDGCAKKNTLPKVQTLLQARQCMAEVLAGIAEIEQQLPPASSTTVGIVDPTITIPVLHQLIASLGRSELNEQAIGHLARSLDAERFDHLENLLDAFEFEKAQAYAIEIVAQLGGMRGNE